PISTNFPAALLVDRTVGKLLVALAPARKLPLGRRTQPLARGLTSRARRDTAQVAARDDTSSRLCDGLCVLALLPVGYGRQRGRILHRGSHVAEAREDALGFAANG